jgi:hypothetical protein
MRKIAFAGAVTALFLGLAAYGLAQTKPEHEHGGMTKSEPFWVNGKVVEIFKREQLIQLKIEKELGSAGAGGAESGTESGAREPDKVAMPRPGEVVFMHLAEATYRDNREKKKGESYDAEHGFKHLDEGMSIRCECVGTHELPPPREWPKEARSGSNILVYHCKQVEILPGK